MIQLLDKEISQVLATHVLGSGCNRNHILKSIHIELKNRVRFYPVFRFPNVIIFIHLSDVCELCIVLKNSLEQIATILIQFVARRLEIESCRRDDGNQCGFQFLDTALNQFIHLIRLVSMVLVDNSEVWSETIH